MAGKILVTDSLFIHDEHVRRLEAAGYEVERLDKPEPSEEELCEAIKGKVGYIVGGIEKVTERVIENADSLKAMAGTFTEYVTFIPAYRFALDKGILISNTPGAPTQAVAEWGITAALMMQRNFFDLGRTGDKTFLTSPGIEGQTIGIIGLGHIGTKLVAMVNLFAPKKVQYYSRNRHEDAEKTLGLECVDLTQLLSTSDVVFLCVSRAAGDRFMSKELIAAMKHDALLVCISHKDVVDEDALFDALQDGRVRAASDDPMRNHDVGSLSPNRWFSFNASNAFNTHAELKLVSDMATMSLINMLATGTDEYIIG